MSALVQSGIKAGGRALRLCAVVMLVTILIAMTLTCSFVIYGYAFSTLWRAASAALGSSPF
jgi:hypothetical protein